MPRKSKTPPPVTSEQNASEAFAAILQHNYKNVLLWEEAARSWKDIEGVHQMRVGLRKMRSTFSLFRSAIPKAVRRPVVEEIRWVGGQLGLARDLDVFISEGLTVMEGRMVIRGREKLLDLAARHRALVYREQVCRMLEGGRYRQFKDNFSTWLSDRPWEKANLKGKQRKALESNLVIFARKVLDRQETRVLAAGSHVNRESPQEMHKLRIECKKLRYATEFFSPLFEGMDKYISHMKGLQDLLGLMNDISVMHGLLDVLLSDVDDHEVLEYAGGVVGWRSCEFYRNLDSFDGIWEEFTEAKHPWWKNASLAN